MPTAIMSIILVLADGRVPAAVFSTIAPACALSSRSHRAVLRSGNLDMAGSCVRCHITTIQSDLFPAASRQQAIVLLLSNQDTSAKDLVAGRFCAGRFVDAPRCIQVRRWHWTLTWMAWTDIVGCWPRTARAYLLCKTMAPVGWCIVAVAASVSTRILSRSSPVAACDLKRRRPWSDLLYWTPDWVC